MAEASPTTPRPRLVHVPALDGLRGLAALVVVVRHTMNGIAMPVDVRRAMLQGPLALVLNSTGAVQIFFVLSGYVLAGSLTRGMRGVDLLQYNVRRIFRIHPPYVAGVLFAWALSFLYSRPLITQAFAPLRTFFMSVHPSVAELLTTLWFPGEALNLLPVGWTLRVEMVQSFLLPLLMVAARLGHGLPLLVLAGILATINGVPESLRHTLAFSLGIVTFRERELLERAGARLGRAAGLLLPAALLLHTAPLVFGQLESRQIPIIMPHAGLWFLVMSLGAWAVVTAVLLRPRPRRFLSIAPIAWLGQVSYSLYLVHLTVLHTVTWLWPSQLRITLLGGIALLAAVLVISLPLAWIGWRLVERPSIFAGNWVCRRLARRLATRPLPSARADVPDLGVGVR